MNAHIRQYSYAGASMAIAGLVSIACVMSPASIAEAETYKPTLSDTCQASFPLSDKDVILQARLEEKLSHSGLQEYIDDNALAVSLVDITDGARQTYYAGLNDDIMYYAASLPKIAILLGVVDAVHRGRLRWGRSYNRRLANMIRASSNRDASWGVDLVGMPALGKLLRDPRYCFYDDIHGGMWVGRPYRKGGESYRDPNFNISHGATARQAARFYTMLYHGELVTPEWSSRMLQLMGPPEHNHKFVAGLNDRQGTVFVARKSGTWRHFHSDSAIIRHHGRVYVAIALSEHKNGERLMQEVIALMDDLIMEGWHRRPG